jgi:hypothetical protein
MDQDPALDVDELGVVHPLRAPRALRDGREWLRLALTRLPRLGQAFVALALIDVVAKLVTLAPLEPVRVVGAIADGVIVLLPAIVLAARPRERPGSALLAGSIFLAVGEIASTGLRFSDALVVATGGEPAGLDAPRMLSGLAFTAVYVGGWLLLAFGARAAWRSPSTPSVAARGSALAVAAAVLAAVAVVSAIAAGLQVVSSDPATRTPFEVALLIVDFLVQPVLWLIVGLAFADLARRTRSRAADLAAIGAVLVLLSLAIGYSSAVIVRLLGTDGSIDLQGPVLVAVAWLGRIGPVVIAAALAPGLERQATETAPKPASDRAVSDPAS